MPVLSTGNTEKGTVNNTVPEYSENPYHYGKTPHHLTEALFSSNLTATELKIVLYIQRYSINIYSKFNKDFVRQHCQVAITTLAEKLNQSERQVRRSLDRLQECNIIKVVRDYSRQKEQARTYQINLNIHEWSEPITTSQDISISYIQEKEIPELPDTNVHQIGANSDTNVHHIDSKFKHKEREETPPDLSLTPEQIKQVQEAFPEAYRITCGTTYTGNKGKIFAQIGERIKTKMQDKGLPETQFFEHTKDFFIQAAESVKSNPFLRKFTPQLIFNNFDEYYDQHAFKFNSSDSEIEGALW